MDSLNSGGSFLGTYEKLHRQRMSGFFVFCAVRAEKLKMVSGA